jgi:sugar lactone lactonase YvrE
MVRRILVVALLALLILPTLVTAQGQVEWVRMYDPSLGEFPEGIAIDLQGNIYVGMAMLGHVRKIGPDGEESIFFQFPAGSMVVGLAADALGNVYAGVVFPLDPDVHGVWKIDRSGQGTHLPGSEAIGIPPNGLAFDPRGNLYVTDSWVIGSDPAQGSIWRIPPGGPAELWYRDADTLGGLGQLPPPYNPIGANGIAFYHGALYVANTERGHIVRIPVLAGGGPGEPEVLVDGLHMIDGIALDARGTLFAAIIGYDRIVSVCPRTGAAVLLAEGGPIDGPASLAMGAGRDSVSTLFFTNYAVLSPDPQPGVLTLELGWPPGNRP